MAVEYPGTLPQAPQRNGYTQKNKSNVIRSKMDVGEAKVRRRYVDAIKDETWSMPLDPVQLPIFQAWHKDDLEGGVLRFDFEDMLTGLIEEYRFVDMPTYSPYGECGSYLVSFTVEQLP